MNALASDTAALRASNVARSVSVPVSGLDSFCPNTDAWPEPAAARSTSRLAMRRTLSNDPGSPAWSPSYAQHSATAAKSSGDTSMLSSATDRRKSVRKIVPGGV